MLKINSTEETAVDTEYYWRSMDSCPVGVKVQLLNIGGVAVYGKIGSKDRQHYTGWAPLPKRIPENTDGTYS